MKKCFLFAPRGDNKRDEQRSPKPLSPLSDHRSGFTNNGSTNGSGTSMVSSSTGRTSLPVRENNLREFTIADLKSATKNFSRSVMIGEGGFGCVYWGTIKSSQDPSKKIEVAVKQLGKRGLQGHKEWVTEVNFLGVVEHPNLVKLLGHCAEDDERGIQRLLVYEYMPNQSVEFHLAPRSPTVLTWDLRLRIAQDAARGLTYLHEEMDFQVRNMNSFFFFFCCHQHKQTLITTQYNFVDNISRFQVLQHSTRRGLESKAFGFRVGSVRS